MNIKPEEEERVRKAAKLINEKIKDYSKKYAYKDIQDLLSMVALRFATGSVKYQEALDMRNEQVYHRLKSIDEILSETIL